ncbi:hypothetical protein L1987_31809 [Smallanthus sonchifolius]|uniref:Uncharacterized protein n=1 Tax=Smallanthus sonchifolius TaxID=185202 RepID=A0ACB9I850_9ASTR|nr:hypothetical protein L1987_31809 [Smallanthus sonchifolius]
MISNLAVLLLFLLFLTFQQHQQHIRLKSRAEQAALIELRSSLGLRTKYWPIKSDPCVKWIGVVCENGTVIEINVSGLKRTRIGNQNPSFSLKSLRFLDLSFCEISGAIPFSIGNLSRLSELYLSDNCFTGTVPSSLGLLARLSVLQLSRNSLTGLISSSFGYLGSISLLDISSNQLSGVIPEEFGGLLNLQYLNLSSNSLSSSIPTQLGNLASLVVLDLSSNNFTGNLPEALWSLPGLRFLDASDNSFMGSLPNNSLNDNATVAVFNLSHNMFYGVLTSILRRASSVDLSYNYFQGKMPDYAHDVAFFDKNCLRSLSSQRNVKECAVFYSMRGLPFDNFGLLNGALPLALHDHKNNQKVPILAAFSGGLRLILLFVISVIVAATDDFNDGNLMKNGYSCDVFKGVLENGIHIIIKRFGVHSRNNSYKVELDFFSKISHPRLVPLLGHCLENDKYKFLIYKSMPKGDLSSSLYRKGDPNESSKSLDWITRLKIAVGTAEGLSYLHHECFPPLVHRAVQASCILLDDKYEVRLGSLSKVCTQEGNIHSNRIPRFLRLLLTSQQSASVTAMCAYDVYCFGKSLILAEDLLEEVWAVAVIAKSCLNPKPSRRPLMRFILKALEIPLRVVRVETVSPAKLRVKCYRGKRLNG